MIEFLHNFHFLRPWFLLFLLIPFAFYFKKIKFASLSSWKNICDPNLFNFLSINKNSSEQSSFMKYIYIGLICAALAAAGPSWKKDNISTFTVENPNMFVISLAQDMQLNDILPTRLDRAKFMLSDLTDGIIDGQFGVEVYSNEPYIITPLTDDIQLIKNLLPQIVPSIVPDQGDRLDRAIDLAVERFKAAGYSSGNIILFASDVGQRFDLALEKTKLAAANNYNVYVIDTSYSGSDKLKLLADKGKGIYMSVKEISLSNILNNINNLNEKRLALSENLRSQYIDFGYYLIFVPLLCLLFFFRKGLLILVFCCFATNVYANIFQNANQEGLSLFQKGQYEEASLKFTDSIWRGVALYKQEKFEEALKEFDKIKNEISLYNKGVTQVKLCQYKDALSTFESILQSNPTHEDALYNQQVLLNLFEKAQTDPSVLDCNNQQQNNQNNDQQNSEQNDNSSSNEKNNNSEQQNNEDKNSQNNSEDQNADKEPQNSQQEKPSDNQQNQSSENSEKNDSTSSSPKDQTEGTDNNQKNMPQNSQQEQEVSAAKAQQGDGNEKPDEEALAMQRQYREIPEDTGGLLREFIKKEYMKDRYKNENR